MSHSSLVQNLMWGKSERERGGRLRIEEPVLPRPGGMAAKISKLLVRCRFVLSISVVVSILLVSTSFLNDILSLILEKRESTRSVRDLLEEGTFFPLLPQLMFHLLITTSEVYVCAWILSDRPTWSAVSTTDTVCDVC